MGDAAEFQGQSWGLWPVAVEQGEIAAINALGGERRYGGFVPSTLLKVVGADVMSVGRFEAEEADIVLIDEDPDAHRYRKLVISAGHLVGAILIGYSREAPVVSRAVKAHMPVMELMDALRAGRLEVLDGKVPAAATG